MKRNIKIFIIILFIFTLMGCNKKKEKEEIFTGKWNAVLAVNAETGEETRNLRDVFGSSYETYGSYIELKEDGTFLDAIVPITDGSKSNVGKYSIEKDYYKVGDAYIFLFYSDGNGDKMQRVYLGDSEPYLVLDSYVNGYQLYFQK